MGLLCRHPLFRISKISTFESNSQLCFSSLLFAYSCSEYQRYQLLRAIHNRLRIKDGVGNVVPNIKDINFWEQFTTKTHVCHKSNQLFRISKISTFESNSQREKRFIYLFSRCSEYQRYQLLRAIHNWKCKSYLGWLVVPNIKDINFWEQFTTWSMTSLFSCVLFRISKISTFESNSQQSKN